MPNSKTRIDIVAFLRSLSWHTCEIARTSFGAASAPRGYLPGRRAPLLGGHGVGATMDRARVASAAEASRARIEEDLGAGESVSERVGRVFAGYRCGTMTVRFERRARTRASDETRATFSPTAPTRRRRSPPRDPSFASHARARFRTVGTSVVFRANVSSIVSSRASRRDAAARARTRSDRVLTGPYSFERKRRMFAYHSVLTHTCFTCFRAIANARVAKHLKHLKHAHSAASSTPATSPRRRRCPPSRCRRAITRRTRRSARRSTRARCRACSSRAWRTRAASTSSVCRTACTARGS